MRIYYNNQCIYFGTSATSIAEQEEIKHAWIVRSCIDYKKLFLSFAASDFQNLIIEGDETELFNSFQEGFAQIQAGGGVVWNENEELLMIHRLGKWDLPKGKLDPGENLAECAVREVAEETGLKNIKHGNKAIPTYHIYNLNGNWILKYTDWYEMSAPCQQLVPQAEEDISAAVWVPRNEVNEKLENSYPNIIYLMNNVT